MKIKKQQLKPLFYVGGYLLAFYLALAPVKSFVDKSQLYTDNMEITMTKPIEDYFKTKHELNNTYCDLKSFFNNVVHSVDSPVEFDKLRLQLDSTLNRYDSLDNLLKELTPEYVNELKQNTEFAYWKQQRDDLFNEVDPKAKTRLISYVLSGAVFLGLSFGLTRNIKF